MRKDKIPVFIPLSLYTLFATYAFFGKGIESGIGNWRFYASFIGFLISIIFLFVFYKKVRRDNFKNPK